MTDNNSEATGQTSDPVQSRGAAALGIYFFVLAVLMFYFLVSTWPIPRSDDKTQFADFTFLFWTGKGVLPDTRLFLTVIAAGAIGSLIHTLTSFGDYVGNRKLSGSWVWWFILRTPVGIALALLFYMVVRAGFVVTSNGANSDVANTNPYGIAAICALAGMFSRQATDKLREVFDTLFRTREPVERADPLTRMTPVISGTAPARLKACGPRELTVTGRGFQPGCRVLVNGNPRISQHTSDTQLQVTVDDRDIAAVGQIQLLVENPGQGGGKSPPFTVLVEA
jgi:hypothetical protein